MARYADRAIQPGASVSVPANTSTLVIAEHNTERALFITNDSDTVIYLRLASSGAAVGQGIRLAASGGSFYTDSYSGAVCAIHGGTGSKNLSVAAI